MSRKPELHQWTKDKIKSNPDMFGSDIGNPLIIKEYLAETNPGIKVENLTLEAISESVAVSRIKNQFLEKNPQYDTRDKYRPKKKFVSKIVEEDEEE